MATSVFFNNFNSYSEQTLFEDLIIESIKIYGIDVDYCPRTLVAKDDIYGEDNVSIYNSAYPVEVYVKSYDSYEGDGTFLSKFNIEIRDQIRFVIAQRTFANEIGSDTGLSRPKEGDLIYSSMMKRLFVIMYVNERPSFYPMGILPTYELTCEVFEYSSERLNTGIAEIDDIENKYSYSLEAFGVETDDDYTLVNEDGEVITQSQFDFDKQNIDVLADNDELEDENESDGVADFTGTNPFEGDC